MANLPVPVVITCLELYSVIIEGKLLFSLFPSMLVLLIFFGLSGLLASLIHEANLIHKELYSYLGFVTPILLATSYEKLMLWFYHNFVDLFFDLISLLPVLGALTLLWFFWTATYGFLLRRTHKP